MLVCFMLTVTVNTFNNVFGFVIFSFVDVIFYIHFFIFRSRRILIFLIAYYSQK